jgi:hypothetical protein
MTQCNLVENGDSVFPENQAGGATFEKMVILIVIVVRATNLATGKPPVSSITSDRPSVCNNPKFLVDFC